MLCEKCQQSEATVHLTVCAGKEMTTHSFCPKCASANESWGSVSLDECLDVIRAKEELLDMVVTSGPYPREAYYFIRKALWQAQASSSGATPRDVSGAELLEAFKHLAIERFGKRAKAQLNNWNITRTEDVGAIVFRLIAASFLFFPLSKSPGNSHQVEGDGEGRSAFPLFKSPGNSHSDFAYGFNFDDVFPER